jgi:hypothetical protein
MGKLLLFVFERFVAEANRIGQGSDRVLLAGKKVPAVECCFRLGQGGGVSLLGLAGHFGSLLRIQVDRQYLELVPRRPRHAAERFGELPQLDPAQLGTAMIIHGEHYGRRPVEVLTESHGFSLLIFEGEVFRNCRAGLLVDPHVLELLRRAVGPLSVGLRPGGTSPKKDERSNDPE